MVDDAVTRAARRLRAAQKERKDIADSDIEKLVDHVLGPETVTVPPPAPEFKSTLPPDAPWRPGAGPRRPGARPRLQAGWQPEEIDYSKYPPGHVPGTPM